MAKACIVFVVFFFLAGTDYGFTQRSTTDNQAMKTRDQIIKLPAPRLDGSVSIEKALQTRRSERDFSNKPLKLAEVAQLLWSAQGITTADGRRTAPSAGALYPLEIYIAAGNVDDLPSGVYKYDPKNHSLVIILAKDKRSDLFDAALRQASIRKAAAVIIFSAAYERTTQKYGERGVRYVHIEVGHASENVYLQAAALGIKTFVIGAFQDDEIKKVLLLPKDEIPLYIMPVGK